jgi:D-alanyl-D-alanine endopeptidase (penicillin-binding protein 7)
MDMFVTSLSKWSRVASVTALAGALALSLGGPVFAATQPHTKATKSSKQSTQKKPQKATLSLFKGRATAKKSAKKSPAKPVLAADRKKLAPSTKLAQRKKLQQSPPAHTVVATLKVSTRLQSLSLTAPQALDARVSYGERMGLRASGDQLDLSSSVALVMDQETNEVLFSKNDSAVLPIASLTKLMTGLVIADANLPMNELITITDNDVDTYKNSRSRLTVGTSLTRGELMHLALMSSENRAAHALGRTYPGGMREFVAQMNAKARSLGMMDTRYVEPTGLMSQNQSSARDLATLVSVAYQRPILRSLSTSPGHQVELGHRVLQFNNSNRLVHSPLWDIGLQKTGYISEAGRCLVMQAKVAGRQLIMVFLDSAGKFTRLDDAERVRRWVEAQGVQHHAPRPQG